MLLYIIRILIHKYKNMKLYLFVSGSFAYHISPHSLQQRKMKMQKTRRWNKSTWVWEPRWWVKSLRKLKPRRYRKFFRRRRWWNSGRNEEVLWRWWWIIGRWEEFRRRRWWVVGRTKETKRV